MTTPHTDSADELARYVQCMDCCSWKKIQRGDHHPWCGCGSDRFLWGNEMNYDPDDESRTRPAPETAGEVAAWGQLGTLNGHSYLREVYDRFPYPPPANVVRNLNLVPLYTAPAPAQRMSEEQERAGFEQWAKDYGRCFLNRAGEGYEFAFTNEAWVAWKARAAWGVKLDGGAA